MLPQASYIIRARAWLAWTILLLSALPIALSQTLHSYDRGAIAFLFLSFLFCLILYITIKKIQIYIDDDKMVISDLLRKRTLLWADVIASDVTWSVEGGHSASLNWIFETIKKKHIEIKLGYYSRGDMTILANQLIEKAKTANISKKIHNMAENKFPWYFI